MAKILILPTTYPAEFQIHHGKGQKSPLLTPIHQDTQVLPCLCRKGIAHSQTAYTTPGAPLGGFEQPLYSERGQDWRQQTVNTVCVRYVSIPTGELPLLSALWSCLAYSPSPVWVPGKHHKTQRRSPCWGRTWPLSQGTFCFLRRAFCLALVRTNATFSDHRKWHSAFWVKRTK